MTKPLIGRTNRRSKKFLSKTNRILGQHPTRSFSSGQKQTAINLFPCANCLTTYEIIRFEAPPGPAQGRQMMSRYNAWRILVAIFVLSLSGCSIADKRNASNSRDDYQACLAANPDNVQACEDKRLIMERDQHNYERRCQWLPCF